MADLYRVLGVERDADSDRIKKAYKRLVRQYHPDINQAPGAADRFQEIKKAYVYSFGRIKYIPKLVLFSYKIYAYVDEPPKIWCCIHIYYDLHFLHTKQRI